MKRIPALLALLVPMAAPWAALAQDAGPDFGHALMSLQADAGPAVATGWHTCTVVRTGAGWGNHYIALTCPDGPFENTWHIMSDAQKDAMLATALAAVSTGNQVQVFITQATTGYNEISALYFHD